jgi:hypothetical protein
MSSTEIDCTAEASMEASWRQHSFSCLAASFLAIFLLYSFCGGSTAESEERVWDSLEYKVVALGVEGNFVTFFINETLRFKEGNFVKLRPKRAGARHVGQISLSLTD